MLSPAFFWKGAVINEGIDISVINSEENNSAKERVAEIDVHIRFREAKGRGSHGHRVSGTPRARYSCSGYCISLAYDILRTYLQSKLGS